MKKTILSILVTCLLSPFTVFAEEDCETACCAAPQVVKYNKPELPTDLLKPGESAQIILRCAISAEGELIGIKTVSSSHEALEKVVIAAVNDWKFEPSLEMGEAQRATIDIPFQFTVAAK